MTRLRQGVTVLISGLSSKASARPVIVGGCNGFPFDAEGRLVVDDMDPVVHGHAGLPFTASGALAVAPGGIARIGARGLAFDGAGRVVVTTLPGAARRTGRVLGGAAVGLLLVGAALGALLYRLTAG